MICPKCKNNSLTVDVSITGGCTGGHGDGYCYCDLPDVSVELVCYSRIDGHKPRYCGYHKELCKNKSDLEDWMNARLEKE